MKKLLFIAPALALGIALVTALPAVGDPNTTLQVPPPYGGTGLAKQVGDALANLPYYTLFDNMGYTVSGSTVTLTGQVTDPFLKQDAGNLVKQVKGVTQVNNNLEVLPDSPMDWQIRRAVFRTLYSQRSPLFRYGVGGNKAIHIIVDNGHVTLVGVVNSESDKQIAYMLTNQVPNIFSVTNDLQVVKNG